MSATLRSLLSAVLVAYCSVSGYEYVGYDQGYDYAPSVAHPVPQVPADTGYFYFPPSAGIYNPVQKYHDVSQAAICRLQASTNSSVTGEIRLFQASVHEPVVVSGLVSGLKPGLHGFHLHRDGNLTNDCKDAGPHFNPLNVTHAGLEDPIRHAGDMGNIEADQQGYAHFYIYTGLMSLHKDSKLYVGGRAIVVHADRDDNGRGGNEESLKTGNAGARLACCRVEDLYY